MSRQNKLNVVIGILLNANQEVLIARRPLHVPHGGLWEFPGGKIEENELDYLALCRELREEIGIRVMQAKPIMEYSHQYPDYSVVLSIWLVTDYLDEPVGKEGQVVRWTSIAELENYSFPHANQSIINYLTNHITMGA